MGTQHLPLYFREWIGRKATAKRMGLEFDEPKPSLPPREPNTCSCGKTVKGRGSLCGSCQHTKYVKSDPDKVLKTKLDARRRHLLRKYGITPEQYDALLEKQQGVCAICGNSGNGKTQDGKSLLPFMVDHDHVTGKIRALLCAACNFLVGLLEANPVRYEVAKAYLDKYKDKK